MQNPTMVKLLQAIRELNTACGYYQVALRKLSNDPDADVLYELSGALKAQNSAKVIIKDASDEIEYKNSTIN